MENYTGRYNIIVNLKAFI